MTLSFCVVRLWSEVHLSEIDVDSVCCTALICVQEPGSELKPKRFQIKILFRIRTLCFWIL